MTSVTRLGQFEVVGKAFEKLIDCTLFKGDDWQYEKGGYPFNYYVDKKENHVLEYALAGFKKEDINVRIEGNKVLLEVENTDPEDEDIVWVRNGIAKRSLKASWSCTGAIDRKNIKVKYSDGLLRITFPLKREDSVNIVVE